MAKPKIKKQAQKQVRCDTTICLDSMTRDKLRVVKNKNKLLSMNSVIKFLLKNQKKV